MGMCHQSSRKQKPRTDPLPINSKEQNLIPQDVIKKNFFELYEILNDEQEIRENQIIQIRQKKTDLKFVGRLIKLDQFNLNLQSYVKLLEMSHPNIVQIQEFYFFQNPNQVIVVSNVAKGKSLSNYFSEKKNLDEQKLKKIIEQIFSGLQFLHEQRIAHCALNLQKIYISFPDKILNIQINGINFSQLQIENIPKQSIYFCPPENLKNSFLSNDVLQKGDIWSCGIIFYFLVCGRFPFEGQTKEKITKQILKGVVQYQDFAFEVSSSFKFLLQSMLNYDHQDRLTCEQILNYKWFKKSPLKKKIRSNNSQNQLSCKIQQLEIENQLQEASLKLISNYSNLKKEKQQLANIFKDLDQDNDGVVNFFQIEEKMHLIDNVDLKKLQQILKSYDKNGDKQMDIDEFTMAFLDKSKLLSKENIQMVFKDLDKDGSGELSYSEIKSILSKLNVGERELKSIIRTADKNQDGQISLEEFVEMMQKCLVKDS